MNFWKRRGDEAATAQTMQLRDRERHPYAGLRSFMPQRGGELRLYQAVREAVPVVDAAVCKLIRLSGGALVFCEDPETEKRLRDFLERVPAGRGQYGTVELTRLYATDTAISDGIDFYNLTDFSLVICKPDRKVIYSGCEWSGIQEDGELNATVAERVTLTAARRIETTA